jgi:plasmid stabilization system protein ParE
MAPTLQWTGKALADLTQLYAFLASVNQPAAARIVQQLTAAPISLLAHPRLGEQLDEFLPREVRRIFAGQYEIRYEVQGTTITVLRLWHTRESR